MSEIATIQIRKGTAAAWAAANPILANGEPVLVTDYGRIKIGDGSTAFANLPYIDTKIPDATTTSKGLMTAAQAAQIITNKNNITTLNNTVSGHGTRLNNIETVNNTQTTNIKRTLLTLPKVNCVRLYLWADGNEYFVYKGNNDKVLYMADNGEPISPAGASTYKVKLNTNHAIDFIFSGEYCNETIPAKAFNDILFSNAVKATLIIPNYIRVIESTAFGTTNFNRIISFTADPPRLDDVPNVTKVYVPKLSIADYRAVTNWAGLDIDAIVNL